MGALDDIVIRRYNENREQLSKFRVQMLYSPKQRVVWDIVNKSKQLILPIISVSVGGITRDQTRVFNKLEGSYYNPDKNASNVAEHLRQPLPVDITINVSILARYQADVDQILTNFIPYFDPYIVIEWKVPEFNHRINTHVEWSGAINLNYPTDISPETQYTVSADTSFTIKGWIFKAQPKGVGKIYTINSSYTSVKDISDNYIDLSTDPYNTYQTDRFTIHARPQPMLVQPPYGKVGFNRTYTLYGDMFNNTTGVFLSGTNMFSAVTAIDLWAGNQALSALYPVISGTPVDSFTIDSNNKITFVSPAPIATGFADVIVINEGGYGLLKIDSVLPTLNPYPSGSQEYIDYIEPQTPSVSGINIK